MSDGARILVGCQGWRYPDWRLTPALEIADAPEDPRLVAPFYPAAVKQPDELGWYSRVFDIVEVDSTFYAVPTESAVRRWAEAARPDFRFTLKLPRLLTHEARLRRGGRTLSEFCERAEILGSALVAILIQLPPSFGPSEFPTLRKFLPYLPSELPFAIEFRDPAWFHEATLDLLADFNIALTVGSTPWLGADADAQPLQALPTERVYVRMMGLREEQGGIERFSHVQLDRASELQHWSEAILALAPRKREIHVLFDNHYQGFSPGSCNLFLEKLGEPARPYPRDLIGGQMDLGL